MRILAAMVITALVIGCTEPEPEPKILTAFAYVCVAQLDIEMKVRLDPIPSTVNPDTSVAYYTVKVGNINDLLTAEIRVAGVLKDENGIEIDRCLIINDDGFVPPGDSGEWSARCDYQVSQFDVINELAIFWTGNLGDNSCKEIHKQMSDAANNT